MHRPRTFIVAMAVAGVVGTSVVWIGRHSFDVLADATATAGDVAFGTARPAAEFAAARLDGSLLSSRELRGDVVILDFWASWCAPCVSEIPRYNQLYESYKNRGVHLIGVTLESGSVAEVAAFADSEEHRIDYPLVIGAEEIMEGFGPIWGLPTTVLIDSNWQVRKRWTGAGEAKHAQIRQLVDALLNSPPPVADESVPGAVAVSGSR